MAITPRAFAVKCLFFVLFLLSSTGFGFSAAWAHHEPGHQGPDDRFPAQITPALLMNAEDNRIRLNKEIPEASPTSIPAPDTGEPLIEFVNMGGRILLPLKDKATPPTP